MGKDRKSNQPGNLANQASSLIVGEASNTTTSSEFMTSDDFFLVPSRKKSRKHITVLTDEKKSSLLLNREHVILDYGPSEEEASCHDHTSFWRNRSESISLPITENVHRKSIDPLTSIKSCKIESISMPFIADISVPSAPMPKINVEKAKDMTLNDTETSLFTTKSSFSLLHEDFDEGESMLSNRGSLHSEVVESVEPVEDGFKKPSKIQKKKVADDRFLQLLNIQNVSNGNFFSSSGDSAVETDLRMSNGKKEKNLDFNSVDSEETVSTESSGISKKGKHKNRKRKQNIEDEVEMLLKELNLVDNEVKNSGKANKLQLGSNGKSVLVDLKNQDKERQNYSQFATKSDEDCDQSANSAAQKRKEKRLRKKQKRLENNQHDSGIIKPAAIGAELESSEDTVIEMSDANEKLPSNEKKCCEEEKKDKKRPGKKQLAMIHEALKKAKEEEERLKREEEAKQRAAEETERLRLENLKLEQERKDRKKQKEKEKREKMKAEGRLLSKSQKLARARMEATLAAFRLQGIDVPTIGEKKPRSRLGSFKGSYRRCRLDSQQSTEDSSTVSSERRKTVSLSSQESCGKESDVLTSSDSKESWDISSMEGSAVTQELEGGHLSCSEDSDILDENSPVNEEPKSKEVYFETANLVSINTRVKTDEVKASSTEYTTSSAGNTSLRSPVVCVLGHVDSGKTKLLDYIRKTHVQDSEAGHITQQIGATMIPQDALKEKCKMVRNFGSLQLNVPGLLVIDTPGHESFSNLRSRGSSICDIAVLVVDIMHGLEQQTIESINLLKKRKTPFIVALNKIDRLYGWKSGNDQDIEDVINSQMINTKSEFTKKSNEVILQFANHSLNAALFYENNDPKSFVSMVPTSAITGDGMGNLMSLISQLSQTMMSKKLKFSEDLQATVLEVKAIPGLGTTIDVILVNGRLKEGDTIVVAGHEGPIVTQIRSLLMPQPLKELRVKNPYKEYKEVKGAQGVKVTGKDLDKTVAGLPLLVAENQHMVDSLKCDIDNMFHETMNAIKVSERGVYVQASTLGSLEALVDFLQTSAIPYFAVKIGPVVKKDVMKASVMLEHDSQYAVILAFDVKIERDAQDLAETLGVKIFQADIIYHLFDKFIKYRDELWKKKKSEANRLAVFPCKLRILPDSVFNIRDPIVLGVAVEAGTLKLGTPLCVPSRGGLKLGTVTNIEANNQQLECAKKGVDVCIKIEPKSGENPKVYGRHFDESDVLVSRITRLSIDVCKEHFRDVLQPSDWQLIIELKKTLQIL